MVDASLDRLSDVGGRKELRGTRGVVRDELDQLAGELAKPAIRLDHEREKLSILLLSPCEVLAVLGRLSAGSSAQGTLRGTGQVSGCRGVDHRDVDVHQLAAQREADVGVLVVGVVQLEAGLGPGLASSALDLRAEDLDDVIVAHDALGVATGVGQGVPGVHSQVSTAVAALGHVLAWRGPLACAWP
jgi:hypothetical protein